MESAIFVRSRKAEIEDFACPFPLVNYDVQENEDGTRHFVPSNPVQPSQAADFQPAINAVTRRPASGSSRISLDAVDLEKKLIPNK